MPKLRWAGCFESRAIDNMSLNHSTYHLSKST